MNRYSNEILNKINNLPYLKIVIPQNCCDRLNLLYLYSLSLINDESPNEMNETFLFKVDIKLPLWVDENLEIKCYSGLNVDTANDYFCQYRIRGTPYCQV